MDFIEKKVSSGDAVDDVKQGEEREEAGGSNVLDLAEYLQRSIKGGSTSATSNSGSSKARKPAKKVAKKAAIKKGHRSA